MIEFCVAFSSPCLLRRRWLALLTMVAVGGVVSMTSGQSPSEKSEPKNSSANTVTKSSPSKETGDTVVAKVNNRIITARQVDFTIRQALQGKLPADDQLPAIREATRRQRIDQELAWEQLSADKQLVSKADLDREVTRIKRSLKETEKTLEQHLQRLQLTESEWRQEIHWKLSWTHWVEPQLSDDKLEAFFQSHRRNYDGTQLRVAQIFFHVQPNDTKSLAAAKEKAVLIREQIIAKKLTYAEAAMKHSQSPSAESRGEIGWIERHQPMPEAFSLAAFALDVGTCSDPVVTPLGVHLISVLEVKPGQKPWRDSRAAIRSTMATQLFLKLADQQRPNANIELSPWPLPSPSAAK